MEPSGSKNIVVMNLNNRMLEYSLKQSFLLVVFERLIVDNRHDFIKLSLQIRLMFNDVTRWFKWLDLRYKHG